MVEMRPSCTEIKVSREPSTQKIATDSTDNADKESMLPTLRRIVPLRHRLAPTHKDEVLLLRRMPIFAVGSGRQGAVFQKSSEIPSPRNPLKGSLRSSCPENSSKVRTESRCQSCIR